jgi:glycosyltransferase involved in cell wall biosynthesis
MPVFNACRHLDDAVESILCQSLAGFEFIILDDASTDGSRERLRHWAAIDQRIRLIEIETNLGPVRSSNRVASEATAPIVARMDADDISLPDRLREQLCVLENNSDTGLVACLCDVVDANGNKVRGPETWRLLRNSPMVPFAHGTIMYRREVFDRVGGYRDGCEYWEDQDLITRMADASGVLVIPKTLYTVRLTPTSTRATSKQERMEQSVNRMYGCIDRQMKGRPYDDLVDGDAGKGCKIDPRVFMSIGSPVLWAGGRPRLFRRLLKRGRLGPNAATVAAIVWTGWASASPSTLRGFLAILSKLRNFRAGSVGADMPLSWTPFVGGRVRR